MKYEVIFKFGDVSRIIEADSKEEAEKKAEKMFKEVKEDTYCYEVEAEEIKDE